MWDPFAQFEKQVLPNGLVVYIYHWPNVSWQYLGCTIHVGAERDPVGLEGLSHFLEHMVSDNTIISASKIENYFDQYGGYAYLGVTNYFATNYYFMSPSDEKIFSRALDIYGNMLLSSHLSKNLAKAKGIVLGEFNHDFEDSFAFKLHMREQKQLYKGTFMSRFPNPLGTPTSIGRMNYPALQEHYDKYYVPQNMALVAIGGLKPEKIMALVSQSAFAVNKPGKANPLPRPKKIIKSPTENMYNYKFSEDYGKEAVLNASEYRSLCVLPGTIPFRAMSILREMLQKKLFLEIREKRKLAYSVRVHWANLLYFYEIEISCPGLDWRAVDYIHELINQIISDLRCNKKLFLKIQRERVNSLKMMDETANSILRSVFSDLYLTRKIISLQESLEHYQALEFTDVSQIIPYLRPARRWTRITRP